MIKYTKSFLKKLNKENIIGKFFEECRIIAILKQEAEQHFKRKIGEGEAYELLNQLEKDGIIITIIITKECRTTGVIARCKFERSFKVYGINGDAIKSTVKNVNDVLLNDNILQDIPIRLCIRSSYLCDKLSINEWNALFSRYENDSRAKIIDNLNEDKQGNDYAIIETTLFNVLSKGAIMDLKFLASAKIGDKWTDQCLH